MKTNINNFDKYIIQEKIIYDIDEDVELIYSFFEDYINKINKTGIIERLPMKEIISSEILTSEIHRKCHSKNPCDIFINDYDLNSDNFYQPSGDLNSLNIGKAIISLRLNKSAIKFIRDEFSGDISKANAYHYGVKEEFYSHRIKGSIRHELAHWIDDTINNSHISDILSNNGVKRKMRSKDYNTVNILDFEIFAIMQNIYQLSIDFKDIWDNLTFDQMLYKSTSLKHIKASSNTKDYSTWKRKIKRKMYKEGILGINMIKT